MTYSNKFLLPLVEAVGPVCSIPIMQKHSQTIMEPDRITPEILYYMSH